MKDELKKRDVRSLDLGKEGPGTQRPAKHYLTTPIYYASGSPHLGHAYTTLVADCYKRYHLLRGDEVLLTTETDEHGQKIERTAERITRRFWPSSTAEVQNLPNAGKV